MEVVFSEYVAVTDSSAVGQARRGAMLAAERLEFDDTRAGEFALLTTELSRNVLIHGGGGHVLVSAIREGDGAEGRILALDKGPGIPDLQRAMSDGYSTSGTMGAGLGAMKRIARNLEFYSNRTGTVALVELGKPAGAPLPVAGLAVPYPGERFCGDAWSCHRTPERTVVLLVDGLGHGWEAAEAASEAVAVFKKRVESRPGEILEYMHQAMRKTRGGVAAVAEIRPAQRTVVYAGVGNIAGVVLSGTGTTRSLVSHNGTLGLTLSRVQEFTVEWSASSTLVMHSDGLQSRWDVSSYSGLLSRHPAVIGGVLLRDFRRQRDDASVVVVKGA